MWVVSVTCGQITTGTDGNQKQTMDDGLARAVEAAGSIRKLAGKIGISHNAICQWDRVPLDWLLTIEKAVKVPRHKLRPDLYRDYKRIKALEPA